MADIIEVLRKENKYVFFLARFGEKLAEFGGCWNPETKTLRMELSSMYGCICNCSHCEYSYKYEDDATKLDMDAQFIGIKTACERHFSRAERIVISFCRMGEPTLNPEVMEFVRDVWQHFRHKRKKIIFEIPTVLPEDGGAFLINAKTFAAVTGAKIQLVATLHSDEDRYREGVTGLKMLKLDKLDQLLDGWKIRPVIRLQPIEVGMLTSFGVRKIINTDKVYLVWNHITTTLPITLLGHKLVTMRSNYPQHIKYVTRGFEASDVVVKEYDRSCQNISYPMDLDPGQVFSIAMKERLVRKVAELKAVK